MDCVVFNNRPRVRARDGGGEVTTKVIVDIAVRIDRLKQLGVEPAAIFVRTDTLATISGELDVPSYSSPTRLMGLPIIVADDIPFGFYIGV